MATQRPSQDPRIETGVLPVVGSPRSGPSGLVLGIGVVVAGAILFGVLENRRQSRSSPAVRARVADRLSTPAPPPPLFIPKELPPPVVVLAPETLPVPRPPPPPQIVYVPQFVPTPPPALPEVPPPPSRNAGQPVIVFDGTSGPGAVAAANEGDSAAGAGAAGVRSRAGVFANRATTVPQGTLIPAVLETALDSTRPGFARAIVSRDVRGFDGKRVLIPRGSRLIGEYRSEATPGQNRALVNWGRMIRPDGATIAIGSPAGDPLGRSGIRAKVNSHFFERFAGAILQSALDIGVNLASRAGDGTVIVALPGTLQSATTQIVPAGQVTPTLSVRQGTSISIFVARDLDFTGVENQR